MLGLLLFLQAGALPVRADPDAVVMARAAQDICLRSSAGFADVRTLVPEEGWEDIERSLEGRLPESDRAGFRNVWLHSKPSFALLVAPLQGLARPHSACSVASAQLPLPEVLKGAIAVFGPPDLSARSKNVLRWQVSSNRDRYIVLLQDLGAKGNSGLAVVERKRRAAD